MTVAGPAAVLGPYVPRFVGAWHDAEPGVRHREVDGTLVFIDVSGFTALSEKLARRGKVGAEDITDIIGATFTELLAVAYQAGGSLVKFGGDALLLLFTDDGHARRACWAASGMRGALRTLNPIRSEAGSVRLGMSAGICSGGIHLFLVGRTHRELLLAGPVVTGTVAMETAASRGEIVVAHPTADALPSGALGAERGAGVLLARTPPPPDTLLEPVTAEPPATVGTLVPSAVRDHLVAGADNPEHRLVTVAFLRYAGLDDLVSQSATAAADALDDLVTRAQLAAEDNGVAFVSTDLASDGGKIVLAAGAPTASGDDEDRMLQTLRSVISEPGPLALSAGVHRGHAFTGSIGPAYRRTYTLMGDTVNTAARVMSVAEAGQILATPAVLDRTATVYDARALPPVAVKGKREPLDVLAVGEPQGARITAGASLPLIGRDEERDALRRHLAQAIDGHGGVVAVTGEAGAGKTRLVSELRGEVRTIEAHADPSAAGVAYGVFRQLYAAVCADGIAATVEAHAPALAPWLPLLAAPLGVDVPPTPEVDRLDDAFRTQLLQRHVIALVESAVPGPALWIVEDADTVDPASAMLLRRLAVSAGSRPWLMVLTARELDASLTDIGESMVLGPLAGEDATRLATVASAGRILPDRAAAIAERSGGNPLFVRELLTAGDDVPDRLEALVAARIDHLPPPDRALLRQLAVLGRAFDAGVLHALDTDPATVRSRLDAFVEPEGDGLRFRQALFQDVAYEGLPYRVRRSLHQRAAASIRDAADDPDPVADVLSMHLDRAGDHEGAWRFASVAARRARDRLAHAEAAVLYRRALRAAARVRQADPDAVTACWLELGESLAWAGRLTDAKDAYRSGRATASDPAMRARLFQREGAIVARTGRRPDALRLYARGLKVLDGSGRSDGRWRLAAAYASVRREQGRFAEALRWAQRALEDAEREGDHLGGGHACNLLNMIYEDLHDPRARAHGEMALAVFESAGQMRFAADVLNNLGVGEQRAGRWDDARALYARAARAHAQAGNTIGAAVVEGNEAVILSDQGRLEEAEAVFRRLVGTFEASGFRPGVLWARRNLAQAVSRAGRYDEADVLFEETLRVLADGPEAATVRAWRAESLLERGRPHDALAALDEVRDPPASVAALVERVAGCALLRTGESDAGAEHLERALALARGAENAFEEALALDALGASGRDDCAGQARTILARIGVRVSP